MPKTPCRKFIRVPSVRYIPEPALNAKTGPVILSLMQKPSLPRKNPVRSWFHVPSACEAVLEESL